MDNLKDIEARARIRKRLKQVEKGNFGNWRSVGEGIIELKFKFGPGYRVYLGEDGPLLVLILCGGDKSSQKSDIKTAKKYWGVYKSRKRGK